MSETNIRAARIIADALMELAQAVRALGLNGASTNMGAIEVLSKEVRDGMDSIAEAIREEK